MKLYDSLLTIAFPQACAICSLSVESAHNGNACERCWSKTRVFSGRETICFKCGKLQNEKHRDLETLCRQCDDHHYDQARACGVYEFALKASILRLKKESAVAKRLKKHFIDSFLKTPFQDMTRIIPVPLSKKRLLARGFNQASLLANLISKETGTILDEKSFVRSKHANIHRAGMDRKGRHMSVDKSFDVKREMLIKDEKILLVDDVLTSGATASVCAKLLKKNGANKVYVFTIARAV